MTSPTVPLPSFRHPGLDPGSIHPALRQWIPDQVRDDDGLGSLARTRIASEVPQFSAVFHLCPILSHRHPGLDPGSIDATEEEWIPDQVRDDEDREIQCEVAQISGLFL